MASHGHHADDIPQMDYREHERTYQGFVHFAEVGTVACLAIVAALAVGGTKHAWGTAIIGTLLTLVTTGVGIASKSIGWKATAVPLVLMLLALLLLPTSH
ncbi:MAG TPA: aa3-type cytochrome c oxidase subunit IV [Bosea sp. (in: a-proteobacteria)]|jgi:ABC-type branched-subunit amino acid transport system permease subunit|uniref:aa3-type cytochrome c oxidase subunit IV n=1 Tax=Bosea sp. (in: a-proteobacteria) TaxID=1871050 RepID=UPI002E0FE88F|nr:aa3-type cytochrome c oxidase subunit IV [Bosea sp. (in: a-proteobacteria)]